jgi:hypothetical protein
MIQEVERRTGTDFVRWFQETGMVTEFILYSGYVQYCDGTLDQQYTNTFSNRYFVCNICHSEVDSFERKFAEMLGNVYTVSIHRKAWMQITEEQRKRYRMLLQQKQLTPNAILIPYGGVGTAAQVKEYIDLGAEIVAVGTLLAMSAESPIKTETKLAAIQADKEKIKTKNHTFQLGSTVVERKQNMLEFQPYIGQDDANGTAGLVRGLYKKNNKDGHAYLGHSINHVTSILSCTQIIQNLVKCL